MSPFPSLKWCAVTVEWCQTQSRAQWEWKDEGGKYKVGSVLQNVFYHPEKEERRALVNFLYLPNVAKQLMALSDSQALQKSLSWGSGHPKTKRGFLLQLIEPKPGPDPSVTLLCGFLLHLWILIFFFIVWQEFLWNKRDFLAVAVMFMIDFCWVQVVSGASPEHAVMCWPWLDARHSSKLLDHSPSQLNKLLWLGLAERKHGWKVLSCNAHFCPLVQTRLVFQHAWVMHHPQPVTKWHCTFPKNK